MNRRASLRHLLLVFILGLGNLRAAENKIAMTTDCGNASQLLFFSVHPLLEARTFPAFPDSLRRRLAKPLRESGYCLQAAEDYRSLSDTAKYGDHLLLHVLVEDASEPRAGGPATTSTVTVALLRVRDWSAGKLPDAVSKPLASLRFLPSELPSLPNILAEKIVENLRSQYVAHLLIQSDPAGAKILIPNGLEGRTPVEWLLPLGNFDVTLDKPGYLPLTKRLELPNPGNYAYSLQLTKRRFYHSKFIYPALASGVAAGFAYAMENRYYSRYQSYGAQDLRDHPQVFGQTFAIARDYERATYAALALAAVNLGLCFRF